MENRDNEKAKIKRILRNKEAQIEDEKKSTPIAYGIIAGGIVTFIAICILEEKDLLERDLCNMMIWVLIMIGSLTGVYIYRKKYMANEKYKEKVMPDIIKGLFENSFYNKDKFIDKELYYESEIFEKKDRTSYTGSDYLEYETGEVNTVASKLKVTYTTGSGKSTSVHKQFLGEYFIDIFEKDFEDEKMVMAFNKKTSKEDRIGRLIFINIVLSIGAVFPLLLIYLRFGIIGLILSVIIWFFINGYIYIDMGSTDTLRKRGERYGQEFSNLYLLQGGYTIGNKILTIDLIRTLIDFYKHYDVETSISIKRNIMYVAFNTKSDLFNGKLFEDNNEKYAKDYDVMKEIKEVHNSIVDKVSKIL